MRCDNFDTPCTPGEVSRPPGTCACFFCREYQDDLRSKAVFIVNFDVLPPTRDSLEASLVGGSRSRLAIKMASDRQQKTPENHAWTDLFTENSTVLVSGLSEACRHELWSRNLPRNLVKHRSYILFWGHLIANSWLFLDFLGDFKSRKLPRIRG